MGMFTAVFGNGFECYDPGVYAAYVGIIGRVFFPGGCSHETSGSIPGFDLGVRAENRSLRFRALKTRLLRHHAHLNDIVGAAILTLYQPFPP
jgi:hypothetical protein